MPKNDPLKTKADDVTEDDLNDIVDGLDLTGIVEAPKVNKEKDAVSLVDDEDTGDIEILIDPAEGDTLCQLLDSNSTATSIYDQLIKEAAEDVAYLKESRNLQYRARLPIASVSEKRMKGLKTLGDLCALKDKELANLLGGNVDFRSEGFNKVFQFFLMRVGDTLNDTLSSQLTDKTRISKIHAVFFAKLQKSLDGFEDMAEDIYRTGRLPDEGTPSSEDVSI
jgi:hypothetical protein